MAPTKFAQSRKHTTYYGHGIWRQGLSYYTEDFERNDQLALDWGRSHSTLSAAKTYIKAHEVELSRRRVERCWQCDLDIGHVCMRGIPNAKWGVES